MKKRTLGLLLLAVLVSAVGFYPVHLLQIEAPRKAMAVFVRLLQPGDRFSLMYRHSVELCPIWDRFRVDEEYRLILDETVFSSSNTGLPAVLGKNEKFDRDGAAFRISNMQRILPAVEIWVDHRYDNTLEFGEQKILLPELAGNTLLRLRIRRVPLAEWAYRKAHSFVRSLARR
ncbi:MAG: DUF1850 domain-containing protein [Deltaproteobacteria bacterium]|nr:DUF1850 domain-containing protein [Deltaproteobacteria bacterium]